MFRQANAKTCSWQPFLELARQLVANILSSLNLLMLFTGERYPLVAGQLSYEQKARLRLRIGLLQSMLLDNLQRAGVTLIALVHLHHQEACWKMGVWHSGL